MRVPSLFWLALTLAAAGCGGSSTGGQEQDPAQLIKRACDNAVALQCDGGATMQTCTDGSNQALAEAKAKGCVSEFDAAMECFADKITDCSQTPGVVCGTQLQALDTCEAGSGGSSNCSAKVGGAPPGAPTYYQECDLSCATFTVHCETSTSPTLVCTCTTGPKSGTTFTPTSCQDLSSTLGAQYCQG